MKKRILSTLLALCMVLGMLPISAFAATPSDFTIENGVLTKYTGGGGDVVIPNGVTSIGDGAFWNCTMTSVSIPSGVISIGDRAFQNCPNLTSISIPSGVTSIGESAFLKCTSLTSVSIPSSVTSIGDTAFWGCTSLTGVNIPSGVTTIGVETFFRCTSLTSVNIPSSVTSIESGAFKNCTNLTSVNIPSSTTSIGASAFRDCTSLTSVNIPSGVTTIPQYAFCGCTSLTSVSIPSSVTHIIYDAFSECTRLKEIYYSGSEAQWRSISISYDCGDSLGHDNNASLKSATIHYAGDSSGTVPSEPTGYSATFDARPGKFLASDLAGNGYFHEAGGTLIAPRRSDGRYVLEDVPPIPVREGYTFVGWRINFVDGKTDSKLTGQIVKDLARFNFSADLTFEAEWKEEKAPLYRIDFDPNGGTITSIRGFAASQIVAGSQTAVENDIFVDRYSGIGMMMTGADGRLDGFPVVEREGYTLLGWGVSEKDLASTATVFSRDTRLTAYWTKGKVYTVTFNLNGKSGTVPQSQKVAAGGTVNLPAAPTASDGSKFLCWGYTEDNKTLKEWKADYPVNGDLTLYAAWAGSAASTQAYFGYSFGNNAKTFGYSTPYWFPYDSFVLIYGDTALAKDEHSSWMTSAWDGNCYGMCATSVMFITDKNNSSVSSFRNGASMPKDLAVGDYNSGWGINLTRFIEAMHVSQSSYDVSVEKGGNYGDLNGMCQAVLNAKSAGQGYPLISIFGNTSNGELGGHTVAGYDLVDVDAATSRLMVYDPNYPSNTQRYITLQKNGSGQYVGWHFRHNNTYDWGTGYSGTITYNTYDCYSKAWRGSGPDSSVALLNIGSDNAVVRDKAGNTVATVKNGVVSSNQGDVCPVALTDASWSGVAVWLPVGSYTVTNTDRASKSFDVTMTNVDQSAAVSTSGSTVSFTVDDGKRLNYVKLDGAGVEYTITLTSTLDADFKDVCLSGTVDDSTLVFAQSSGKLYSAGTTDCGLQIDGVFVSAEENLSSEISNLGQLVDSTSGKPSVSPSFTDVPSDAYYYDAVAWAVKQGITAGTSATTFSPNVSCTRAQMVTFLWRAAGSPAPQGNTNPFVDVQSGTYYYNAVLWAVEQGITAGTSATTFSPNANVTRSQTVTFLWRAAGSPAASGGSPFGDVVSDAYYASAVQWAVDKGVTAGTSTTTFSPNSNCTRAQIVTFLYRDRAN